MKLSVRQIAQMIDHSLLHPTLTDRQMEEGCRLARDYSVASVCIKPYAIGLARAILKGSGVAVGTVVGFPHGNSRIDIKCQEALSALKDGATELDAVVNIGKVISRDWVYCTKEILSLAAVTHEHDAVLKVIFENDFLVDKELKIMLCRISAEARADFVKTSTGFGFVKQPDGYYTYRGAVDEDVILMRQHCPASVKVKAAGGIRTLDDVVRLVELGVERIGATATKDILDEAKKRFGA